MPPARLKPICSDNAPPSTVRLHPRLTEIYAEKVQQLEKALNDPDIRQEAAEVLRGLIDRIELRPRSEGKGVDAILHGNLAEILLLCEEAPRKSKLPGAGGSGSLLSVVAGAGFAQERTKWMLRRSA